MENRIFKDGKILIEGKEFDPSVGISEVELIPENVLRLYNNLKYVFKEAKEIKEKNPNQLVKVYRDNQGREIKVWLNDKNLGKMKKYIKELEDEWGLGE